MEHDRPAILINEFQRVHNIYFAPRVIYFAFRD
jgi:hypothetical protein